MAFRDGKKSLLQRIAARWGSGAGEIDDVLMDAMTNTLVGISYTHHEVHEGDSFIVDVVDETLANDATIILAFKTPSGTKRVHMFLAFSTLVGGDLELWEDATWSNQTGSLQPIINRKREAGLTSSGVLENQAQVDFVASDNMILNPTGFSTGTSLHRHYAWGKKERINAGGVRETDEVILRPDAQYAVVFTADGGSNKAQVHLNWYEHTDSH